MTVVVTFQRFANWKDDIAIYSQNSDDDFGELVAEVISNPIRNEQKQIDFDFVAAFDRCPRDHAIFVYETEIPAHELIEHEDTFYVEKHDNFNLVYATPVGFPD
jgi:hypothetical protein